MKKKSLQKITKIYTLSKDFCKNKMETCFYEIAENNKAIQSLTSYLDECNEKMFIYQNKSLPGLCDNLDNFKHRVKLSIDKAEKCKINYEKEIDSLSKKFAHLSNAESVLNQKIDLIESLDKRRAYKRAEIKMEEDIVRNDRGYENDK